MVLTAGGSRGGEKQFVWILWRSHQEGLPIRWTWDVGERGESGVAPEGA